MKTPEDYAEKFINKERAKAGQPPIAESDQNTPLGSAFVSLSELFAACQREAIEEAALFIDKRVHDWQEVARKCESDGRYDLYSDNMRVADMLSIVAEGLRALLPPGGR